MVRPVWRALSSWDSVLRLARQLALGLLAALRLPPCKRADDVIHAGQEQDASAFPGRYTSATAFPVVRRW